MTHKGYCVFSQLREIELGGWLQIAGFGSFDQSAQYSIKVCSTNTDTLSKEPVFVVNYEGELVQT